MAVRAVYGGVISIAPQLQMVAARLLPDLVLGRVKNCQKSRDLRRNEGHTYNADEHGKMGDEVQEMDFILGELNISS